MSELQNGYIARLTPWWWPVEDAVWFDYIEDVNLVAVQEQTIIDFTLPVASRGVIRWFGQAVYAANYWDYIKWQIKVNSGPDRVYGSIVGEISSIQVPTDTYIPLTRGAHAQLIVSNIGTQTSRVVGRIRGWHWLDEK